MKNKQKGRTNKLLIAIVVMALVVAGIYYFKQPANETIGNDTDLMQASQQLDAVDVDTPVDASLQHNTVDMDTF